ISTVNHISGHYSCFTDKNHFQKSTRTGICGYLWVSADFCRYPWVSA
ncbi:20978_t:CDS:1, partial [Racocetra persica]